MFCRFRSSLVFAALAASAGTPHAAEVYGGIGLPGAMIGFAQPVSDTVTLRGDFATLGSHDKDYDEDGIKYKGHLKTDRLGLFADWFPFNGGFRLTGGLTFNSWKLDLNAQGNGSTITIGNNTYALSANDRFDVTVEFPKTTPYLGIGYGHQKESGLGFLFDLGVSIGKAKLSESHSGPNLGSASQADIDKELAELRDGVGKVKVLPQLSIGLNYRF